jgi:cellobiose-specific phosphotransferase system component IIB
MLYSYLFTTIALIFGLHFYKNRYPKEFEMIITQFIDNIQKNETLKPYLPILTTTFYNIIYIYSLCQVAFNKTMRLTSPHIKSLSGFVQNNFLNKINTNHISNIILDKQDGFVLVKSEKNDIIVFNKIPDSLDNIKYEKSTLRFLALCLKLKTDDSDQTMCYSIYLSLNSMNFYVVGNIFGPHFFKYYLQHILNVTIDNNKPFLYILEIMDQNVKITHINETQTIVIKKDDYEIIGPQDKHLVSEPKEIAEPKEINSINIEKEELPTNDNVDANEEEKVEKEDLKLEEKTEAEPKTVSNILDYTTVCF